MWNQTKHRACQLINRFRPSPVHKQSCFRMIIFQRAGEGGWEVYFNEILFSLLLLLRYSLKVLPISSLSELLVSGKHPDISAQQALRPIRHHQPCQRFFFFFLNSRFKHVPLSANWRRRRERWRVGWKFDFQEHWPMDSIAGLHLPISESVGRISIHTRQRHSREGNDYAEQWPVKETKATDEPIEGSTGGIMKIPVSQDKNKALFVHAITCPPCTNKPAAIKERSLDGQYGGFLTQGPPPL